MKNLPASASTAAKRSAPVRSAPVRGEPWVWLTGMGLVVAFGMAALLLGVIAVNGLSSFWPRTVTVFTIKEQNSTSRIAGATLKEVVRYDGGKSGEAHDLHLFTGNKDAYGHGFRYIRLDQVTATEIPTGVMRIERQENGDAIGFPSELTLRDFTTKAVTKINAEDPTFEKTLLDRINAVNQRWSEIRHIEKGAIGRNSKALAAAERQQKATSSPELDQQIAELKKEFKTLSDQAGVLRSQQNIDKLAIILASGEKRTIPLGKIVDITWPNRESFFGRLGLFFERILGFLWNDPREANTEGGIFPAIFGTFVMTLLMSVGVVPIGVLAAIYLREYAKQGPLVRSVRIAVNNLAGVPSIVFGVFGLGFFVYIMGSSIDELFFSDILPTPTFGTGGILWAAATLGLMTVPVVIVATEEAIAAVPRGAREASLALGGSKWQTIQRIILPASIPGILTGTILAMARGAGEVAPLMLVGVVKLAPTLPLNSEYPFVHLDQKFMHLGFHIYDLGFQSPDSEAARPAVFATTLILILLVLMLNLAAILLRERFRRRLKTSTF